MAGKAAEIEAVENVKEIIPYSEEDKVEIPPLPYDTERYSHPVSVTCNGKIYRIQRGVSGIKVPRAVAEILEQSENQKKLAGQYINRNTGIKSLGDFGG